MVSSVLPLDPVVLQISAACAERDACEMFQTSSVD
jgi:hypothetical protein